MKKHKVVAFLFISFFLCSSLTVQAASQPVDIGQKEKPGKLSPPPLPMVPGKAPRNKQTIKKTVALPDLSISKLSASPKLVSSGDKVKLSADVKNSGKNTLKNVKVSFYNKKSKKKLGDDVIVIGGGKTKKAAITVPLKGKGTITIKAVVNPGRSIAESNKRNNEKTTSVSIKKPVMAKSHQKLKKTGSTPKIKTAALKIKPDLTPVTLKLDKNTVDVGKTVVAKVRVKNIGAKKMKNIPVSFFLGRKQIGTKKVSIPANSSSPVSFRYVAQKPGSFTVSTKVDPGDIIDERNERNNSANTKLQVNKPQLATIAESSSRDNIRPNRVPSQLFKKRPDLLPTRIWVDDATCRLWVEWKNQGAAAPEKNFTERYSLKGTFRHGSNMMTSHSFDSGQLYAIGSPYSLNHGVTDYWEIVILGDTHVTFTIDGTDVHTETNENNNTMEVDVTCATRIPNLGKFNIPGQIRTIDPDSLPPGLDQNGFNNPNTPDFNRNVQDARNQMDMNKRKVDRGLPAGHTMPTGHGVSSRIGGVERKTNTPGGGFLDDIKNPSPNVRPEMGSHIQRDDTNGEQQPQKQPDEIITLTEEETGQSEYFRHTDSANEEAKESEPPDDKGAQDNILNAGIDDENAKREAEDAKKQAEDAAKQAAAATKDVKLADGDDEGSVDPRHRNTGSIKAFTSSTPKGGIRFVDGEEGGTTGGTPEGGMSENPHMQVNPGAPDVIDGSNASFDDLSKKLKDAIIQGGPRIREE